VARQPDDAGDRLDGADVVVLAPACVARDDVLALVQSIRRRCGARRDPRRRDARTVPRSPSRC
jgi:hypothetical protein